MSDDARQHPSLVDDPVEAGFFINKHPDQLTELLEEAGTFSQEHPQQFVRKLHMFFDALDSEKTRRQVIEQLLDPESEVFLREETIPALLIPGVQEMVGMQPGHIRETRQDWSRKMRKRRQAQRSRRSSSSEASKQEPDREGPTR